jgi:hypothetical protein
MALFDRLIAEKDTPRVIDVSHRAYAMVRKYELTPFGRQCLADAGDLAYVIVDFNEYSSLAFLAPLATLCTVAAAAPAAMAIAAPSTS